MNTTHDIHTEINTTALFHNVKVLYVCYCRNINNSPAFSLVSSLKPTDVILLAAIYKYYHMNVPENQPEILTFHEKRCMEKTNTAKQHEQLQTF
jgi:hypothetical protein